MECKLRPMELAHNLGSVFTSPAQLSLSVRIVEAACKTRLQVVFGSWSVLRRIRVIRQFACAMRVVIANEDAAHAQVVESRGLHVAMVTAVQCAVEQRRWAEQPAQDRASLDVAEELGCDLIRVCLKSDDDLPRVRRQSRRRIAKFGWRTNALPRRC